MAKRKTRILVWQWGRFGAGPRYAYELARALGEIDDVVPLLSLSTHSELYAGLPDPTQVDFPVATYGSAKEAIGASLRLDRLRAKLAEFVAKARPDIAICAMLGPWDLFVTRWLRQLGVPVMTIIHDAATHPGDRYQLMHLMQGRIIRSSAAIVTLSDYVKTKLEDKNLLQGRLQRTIPHAAFGFPDLSLPAPRAASCGLGEDKLPLRLLLAGRLKSYKGGALLVEALRGFSARNVCLRIAGATAGQNWIEQARSLPDCQLRLEWLSEAALVEEVDACDVLVAPYIEASQSGVVALAHARGRPVIATPVGGLPEQIETGVTGLVASDVSANALGEAISQLANVPSLCRLMGVNARAYADNQISWPVIATQFAELANEVIKSARL